MMGRNFNIFPGHKNPSLPTVESTEETFQMDERNARNVVNYPWTEEDHFHFGIILISIFTAPRLKFITNVQSDDKYVLLILLRVPMAVIRTPQKY